MGDGLAGCKRDACEGGHTRGRPSKKKKVLSLITT